MLIRFDMPLMRLRYFILRLSTLLSLDAARHVSLRYCCFAAFMMPRRPHVTPLRHADAMPWRYCHDATLCCYAPRATAAPGCRRRFYATTATAAFHDCC